MNPCDCCGRQGAARRWRATHGAGRRFCDACATWLGLDWTPPTTPPPRPMARAHGTCRICGGPTSARHVTRCWRCFVASDDLSRMRRRNGTRQAEVDNIAVERLIAGQPPAHTTRGERQQAVVTLTRYRLSAREIAERLGVAERTVVRLRSRAAA